jgi:hypothetical protein
MFIAILIVQSANLKFSLALEIYNRYSGSNDTAAWFFYMYK